jgi:hypothetical protein
MSPKAPVPVTKHMFSKAFSGFPVWPARRPTVHRLEVKTHMLKPMTPGQGLSSVTWLSASGQVTKCGTFSNK